MQTDNEILQQRVRQRLRKMQRFFIHLLVMVGGSMAFGIAAENSDTLNNYAIIIIPALVLSFIAHALWLAYHTAADRMMQQEMSQQQFAGYDKPKRKRHLEERLLETADGEIYEVVGDEDQPLNETTTSSYSG